MIIIEGITLDCLKEDHADIEIFIKHDGSAWALENYERWTKFKEITVKEIIENN